MVLLLISCISLSYEVVATIVNAPSIHQISSTVRGPISSHAGTVYDDEVEKLIGWITENSDYKDLGKPRPLIMRANQAFMNNLWEEINGKPPNSRNSVIGALHVWRGTLTDDQKSTVYIPMDFDIKNPLDQRTLVHELVHHLQYWNGKPNTISCRKELEFDAYMLSAKYLRATGYRNTGDIYRTEKFAREKGVCSRASKDKYIESPKWLSNYD